MGSRPRGTERPLRGCSGVVVDRSRRRRGAVLAGAMECNVNHHCLLHSARDDPPVDGSVRHDSILKAMSEKTGDRRRAAGRRRGAKRTSAAHGVHALDATPSSPAPSPVIDISDTESGDDAAAAASSALSTSAVERIASTLTTQAKVDAVCRNHDVPTEFAARPAGELRACSEPPRGSVCVYAHMLETGVRFPLHDFFCDALTHFHLAPGQLSINGWRVLVGFVALCHEAGVVPPSMALLRHFFKLYNRNDWYYFRCRADAGVLFTGTSYAQSEREWKGGFFFLTSQESWRCPCAGASRRTRAPPQVRC
ncbi:hypothetical protein D1007_41788 [Hordeum vulgare]|nr:hypothetical protein D1007_41788 [Hordeum vulgare]